jgi:hypothetical protein
MNKKAIILRCFQIALTLYFIFFIWKVWFESPENYGIVCTLEEWYMKSIGKVFSLMLLPFVIAESMFWVASFLQSPHQGRAAGDY